jgi:hypothetical protein
LARRWLAGTWRFAGQPCSFDTWGWLSTWHELGTSL